MPISMWEKSGNEESLTNSIPSIPSFLSERVGGENGQKVEA